MDPRAGAATFVWKVDSSLNLPSTRISQFHYPFAWDPVRTKTALPDNDLLIRRGVVTFHREQKHSPFIQLKFLLE